MINEALDYVERGWPILPLLPMGKRPNFPVLEEVYGATAWAHLRNGTNLDDVRQWFKCDAETNIGIITGRGLVVADVDKPSKLNGLGFPVTPVAQTSRGYHVYLDGRGLDIGGGSPPWGDIKSDGYVVAPPSVHESGARYSWYPYLSYADIPLAPVPDSILALLNSPTPDPQTPKVKTPRIIYYSRGLGNLPELLRATDEGMALAVVRSCGAKVKGMGKAFRCILPGHNERKPSAALWKPEGGYIAYHDFHAVGGEEWYNLGEVYAAHHTGNTRKLGKAEGIVWWLRALHDIGAVQLPEVRSYPIPQEADFAGTSRASVVKVYDGLALLLALRELYEPGQAGTPYSFTFAAGWCGLACHKAAGRAITWLMKCGYVKRVGQTEKPGRFGKPIGLLALGKPRDWKNVPALLAQG